MSNRLFDTETLDKRQQVFDPANDKILVINDKTGRFDKQYLLPITGLADGLFIPLAEKAQPNGVATLGIDGKVPLSQLPSFISEVSQIDDNVTALTSTWSSFKITQELSTKADVIHALEHIIGGDDVIDGDNLEISYVPTNYIRDNIGTDGVSLEALAAHLKGIDARLNQVGQTFEEYRTLTGLEGSNRSLVLSFSITVPTSLSLFPKTGIRQVYGDDFTVSGNTVVWTGLGLDGVLTSGDKVFLSYK